MFYVSVGSIISVPLPLQWNYIELDVCATEYPLAVHCDTGVFGWGLISCGYHQPRNLLIAIHSDGKW
jgi:hypothetical protein